jgi:hypothetical protein
MAGHGRGHAHLGDLVGEELHDNAASGRTADGDVEVNVGVRHFDGIGCVVVVERELMGEDGGVEEAFWRGTCPALAAPCRSHLAKLSSSNDDVSRPHTSGSDSCSHLRRGAGGAQGSSMMAQFGQLRNSGHACAATLSTTVSLVSLHEQWSDRSTAVTARSCSRERGLG